jgi:hypothetical protein
MITNSQILEAFTRIADGKEQVRLINNHRGIPVSYEATVDGIQGSSIVFNVHKYQCVCLELDRYTYIQSPTLPSILKARVDDVDIVGGHVTLSHFGQASDTIGRRAVVRVQPKEPVDVVLNYQGQKIRGSLVDISTSGIGLYMVSAYINNPGLLRKDERIHLTLRLPNEKGMLIDIRLVGRILYVNQEKGSYRLGLDTSPEAHTRSLITQYITQREAEILRELRSLYDKFHRLKLQAKQKPSTGAQSL